MRLPPADQMPGPGCIRRARGFSSFGRWRRPTRGAWVSRYSYLLLAHWLLLGSHSHLAAQAAVHIKTQGDSFFVKSFYLTKLGSFQGLTGGAVRSETVLLPCHV
jgi:hypothetical protein